MEKFDGIKVYTFKCLGDTLQVFARCIDENIHYKVFGDYFMMFGRYSLESAKNFVVFKKFIRKEVFLFKSECNE